MKAKASVRVDPQGRLMIPAHIRKELNLKPGDELGIDVDPFGTIRIESTKERCCLCGEAADIPFNIGPYKKLICGNCAAAIRKAVK